MGKKKKKKPKKHLTYNTKSFLALESINSMSAIHTKLYEDGVAVIRISDCHNSIKIWNNINNPAEVKEMLEKTDTLINVLQGFRKEISFKDPMNH